MKEKKKENGRVRGQRKGLLSRRVTGIVAICIIAIILVSELCSSAVIQELMDSQSTGILVAKAQTNADIVNQWIEKQVSIVETMKNSLAYTNDTDHEKIMNYLGGHLANNPAALMYYVCFEYDKSVLPADHSTLDLDPTERDWWIEANAKGDTVFTPPYVDAASGQMVVTIASPFEIDGNKAVILVDIALDQLLGMVASISTDESTKAFLLTSDGGVIIHDNADYLPTSKGMTILTEVLDVNLGLAPGETDKYKDYDGKSRFVAIGNVERTGWKLGVTMDQAVIQAQIMGNLKINITLITLITVISLIVISLIVKKMLSPVGKAVEAIASVAEGDFSIGIEKTNRKDEMAVLQNAVYDLVKNISGIIGDANRILGEIASYNLIIDDMKNYPGEFDDLAISVNSIKNILNGLLGEVQNAASGVETGSSQLAQAADSLSSGTTSQAASILKLEEDVNNVADKINKNAQSCNLVNEQLGNLDVLIREGNDEMSKLQKSVDDIEQMSNDIQEIVAAIDNIAFQTNILALNASVEAARAGDNGRGFAVVAEEVRNLAFKCGEESSKTAELIQSCIAAINDAKKHADITMGCLGNVVANSATISEAFDSISSDTAEQAESSNDIQNEIHNISDVVQSNTAAAQETAASSTELSDQANRMTKIVRNFKVKG